MALEARRAFAGLDRGASQIANSAEARSLRALADPFDRLIAGTALRLGVPLISADARIAASAVKTVW